MGIASEIVSCSVDSEPTIIVMRSELCSAVYNAFVSVSHVNSLSSEHSAHQISPSKLAVSRKGLTSTNSNIWKQIIGRHF